MKYRLPIKKYQEVNSRSLSHEDLVLEYEKLKAHHTEETSVLLIEIERLEKELTDVTFERNDYKRYYDVYYK